MPESFRTHPTNVTRTLPHWHKIWLDLTPDVFIAQSQDNWRAFTTQALDSRLIYVFDGQFFHGDFTSLFIAATPRLELVRYIDRVVTIIRPLRPVFIYLYQADVAQGLQRIAAIRGKTWVRRQVQWKVESLYGAAHDYQGVEGWIQLYRDYRALTDDLYTSLPVQKLAIETGAGQWQQYQEQVLAFLDRSDSVPAAPT